MRKEICINSDWKFIKEAADAQAATAAAGEMVSVPHTWNAEDGQDGGNDYYRGTCWYVREVETPELGEGEELWLEFEGVAMSAHVFLDGEEIANHAGGYSTFRVNLTDKLSGRGTLAVSVDNSENNEVYPQYADFTFYGGIYRDVKLLVVPAAHFALGYAGGTGIKVTPEVKLGADGGAAGASATVALEAWVEGVATQATFEVDGQSVVAPVEKGCAQATIELAQAHLWDGVNDPYLYTLKASLDSGDEVSVRFGCRTFEMDPQKGFMLNGRSYPLRGVSRHQDRGGVGNAIAPENMKEDLALIQELGANTIRLAHYQHAQTFYDLCDEAGLCIWAEIPFISMRMDNGDANALSQMRELVVQNYNHPCIVCWGLSNEITTASVVDEALLGIHKQLNDLCHELDATRPTTMANVFMLPTDSPILEIPDINSYNLYFGWYVGGLEDNEQFFDDYHATYPDRVIGFSEYGADANYEIQNTAPKAGDYSEQYQCVYHEHMLKMINERPWLWATHVWNMFDFGADGRNEGGRAGQNQKGLVSIDRKVKKDAFYLYKAYWSNEPFVHLCGRRYVDRAEDTTEVKVYSNASEVELFCDGVSVEKLAGEHVFVFQLPITGEHTLEARAGECIDSIRIRKVAEPNPAYSLTGAAGPAQNWFADQAIDPTCFSIKDKISDIQKSPEGKAMFEHMMASGADSHGDVAKKATKNPMLIKMISRMTLESLLDRGGSSDEEKQALNAALQKIKKP